MKSTGLRELEWGAVAAGGEAETLTGRKKKWKKRQKLNFQPPDTPLNNGSVSQRRSGERGGSYIMTPDAGFSSCGGGGSGVVVAVHPVPAVRLNLWQSRVHHNSYNAVPSTILAHTHTHTLPFSWLVWEPAALIHGLVLSVSLTQANLSVCRHPAVSQAHWQKNCPYLSERAEIDSETRGSVSAQEGGVAVQLHCKDLSDVHKTHFCSSSEGTGTQSSHCLGKTPFWCSQLARPSPYQHYEQENTPHLFSVTPSTSYHSNPRSVVGHINGKQSLHSSNSLFVIIPQTQDNCISPESMWRQNL